MNTMDELQRLFDKYQVGILEFKGKCHDCGKKVNVVIEMDDDGKVVAEGGALYTPDNNILNQVQRYVKCDRCHAKDPILRDFNMCEVFARVVGYMRPTRQWNEGKKAEYKQRRYYKL